LNSSGYKPIEKKNGKQTSNRTLIEHKFMR